jgi:hypothetical protein
LAKTGDIHWLSHREGGGVPLYLVDRGQKYSSIARHQWLTSVILAAWKAEIKRITFPGQPGQMKVCQISSEWKTLGILVCACHPSMIGSVSLDSSLGWPGQKVRPYLQNNQSKKRRHGSNSRTSSKHKALSSKTPVPPKKKENALKHPTRAGGVAQVGEHLPNVRYNIRKITKTTSHNGRHRNRELPPQGNIYFCRRVRKHTGTASTRRRP